MALISSSTLTLKPQQSLLTCPMLPIYSLLSTSQTSNPGILTTTPNILHVHSNNLALSMSTDLKNSLSTPFWITKRLDKVFVTSFISWDMGLNTTIGLLAGSSKIMKLSTSTGKITPPSSHLLHSYFHTSLYFIILFFQSNSFLHVHINFPPLTFFFFIYFTLICTIPPFSCFFLSFIFIFYFFCLYFLFLYFLLFYPLPFLSIFFLFFSFSFFSFSFTFLFLYFPLSFLFLRRAGRV